MLEVAADPHADHERRTRIRAGLADDARPPSPSTCCLSAVGRNMRNWLLFSQPPPLAMTVSFSLSPGTIDRWMIAGVFVPVFLRVFSGSATTLLRRYPAS